MGNCCCPLLCAEQHALSSPDSCQSCTCIAGWLAAREQQNSASQPHVNGSGPPGSENREFLAGCPQEVGGQPVQLLLFVHPPLNDGAPSSEGVRPLCWPVPGGRACCARSCPHSHVAQLLLLQQLPGVQAGSLEQALRRQLQPAHVVPQTVRGPDLQAPKGMSLRPRPAGTKGHDKTGTRHVVTKQLVSYLVAVLQAAWLLCAKYGMPPLSPQYVLCRRATAFFSTSCSNRVQRNGLLQYASQCRGCLRHNPSP